MSKYQSSSPSVNAGAAKIVVAAVIVLIVIAVVASSSVKIVDAGNRGILTHWNAVDLTNPPLDEGFHFVIIPRWRNPNGSSYTKVWYIN